MRTTVRRVVTGLVVVTLGSITVDATAQVDPRRVLAAVILQVQTGTPNPAWYGMELWQTIAAQTGGTGVYPQLRQLGVVRDVRVTQQQALPQGWLYAMTATHEHGQSTWMLGISNITSRIEYASFNVGVASVPLPGPAPAPPSTPGPAPGPAPGPTPGPSKDGSEACKKFPNLC